MSKHKLMSLMIKIENKIKIKIDEREIDVGTGTENGAAKFATVFGVTTKNHRGPFAPPPSGRGLT